MAKFDHEFTVHVPVDDIAIDIAELMDDLSDEAFNSYCDKRNAGTYDVKKMTEAYFHGDIDLHGFFKKLGKKTVLKILEEI